MTPAWGFGLRIQGFVGSRDNVSSTLSVTRGVGWLLFGHASGANWAAQQLPSRRRPNRGAAESCRCVSRSASNSHRSVVPGERGTPRPSQWGLIVLLALFISVISVAGIGYYFWQQRELLRNANETLATIADLKATAQAFSASVGSKPPTPKANVGA